MKKALLIILGALIVMVSCMKEPGINMEAASASKQTQRFVGHFEESASIGRSGEDRILIQKEKEESFEIFSVGINNPVVSFEYAIKPEENLLFYKQLNRDRSLLVKQKGNGEENNVLLLQGTTVKTIASKIAYSDSALVVVSPSQRYIVFCAVEDVINKYGLYLYDLQVEKQVQLMDMAPEELLNDMEWNISWSHDERFLCVANRFVYESAGGRLLNEISGEQAYWSPGGSRLAYIKTLSGYGKSISILDLNSSTIEEVFLANHDEFLPGYMVWNQQETKLAFVTAKNIDAAEGIYPYSSLYSLDLTTKEAIRIDTIFELDKEQVEKLESIHYNDSGTLLAFTIANILGPNLFVFNLETQAREFFLNVEYLHHENNESYVCHSGSSLYFVQGQSLIEVDESLESRIIHKADCAIDDFYISSDGSSMLVMEKDAQGIAIRQITGFSKNI